MKRSQLNAGLLIVSLGLAAAVFFSQKEEEKGAPLTPLAAEAVNKIVLDHPGSPAITLEKHGSEWQITAPVQAEADAFEVNGILALATQETKSTLDPAQVALAELGLEPPAYKVTLNGEVLEFGGTEPLQYRRYIKTGDRIALVDDPPSAALDADYSDLVVKNLLPSGGEIVKITLPRLALSKSADGNSWALIPDEPKATAEQKQKLIDAWKNARAMWNASESEADAKMDAKADRVTLTLKDRELSFIVAARDPQLVLVRPDLRVRYTLSKELVDSLLQLPAEEKQSDAPAQASEKASGGPH